MGGAEVDKEDHAELHPQVGGGCPRNEGENSGTDPIVRAVHADSGKLQSLILKVF